MIEPWKLITVSVLMLQPWGLIRNPSRGGLFSIEICGLCNSDSDYYYYLLSIALFSNLIARSKLYILLCVVANWGSSRGSGDHEERKREAGAAFDSGGLVGGHH